MTTDQGKSWPVSDAEVDGSSIRQLFRDGQRIELGLIGVRILGESVRSDLDPGVMPLIVSLWVWVVSPGFEVVDPELIIEDSPPEVGVSGAPVRFVSQTLDRCSHSEISDSVHSDGDRDLMASIRWP